MSRMVVLIRNVNILNRILVLALMMHSDAVELVNPLASRKQKHKITQVFWQVCDLPKRQRSCIDHMQLAMVFKEKLWKKYSYARIFKYLVEDLLILERDGIYTYEPFESRSNLP